MLFRSSLLIGSFLVALVAHAEPQTPEEYIQIFQSNNQPQQQKAAEAFEWAGLSSPQIFDLVEAKALQQLPNSNDKNIANYESYLVKALAFSGNEKYRATIQKIHAETLNKKVKKYAEESLPRLAVYTRLNTLIVPKPWPDAAYPSLNQRLINMLASDDTDLLLLAAKRINYTNTYMPEVLTQLNASLLNNYKKPLTGDRLEAIAWLCHALAGSRLPEYKSTIEEVEAHAHEKKLRKYAHKYMSYYGK